MFSIQEEFNIQEELKKLPEKPGVYIMKDVNGEIIYIGKAVVLKNRVKSYFQSSRNHSPKTLALVERIRSFEYIVTDSEIEALILECNLIKKHRPRFNILLKDDKTYPYIKVTMADDYPRVLLTRNYIKDGSRYFGPYPSAGAVRETIDLLHKLFPMKTCSRVFPRDIGKERPCLNYHIYQCLGPCQGDVNKEEYRNMMKDVCTFLAGGQEELIKKMEKNMRACSEAFEFEKAAALRDKINSLKLVAAKQKVLTVSAGDQDVIAFAKGGADSCIQVFFIRGGKLIGREHFILDGTADIDSGELMNSFVKQFYNATSFVPGEVILQEDIDEINIIESWLTDKRGGRVHIKVPRKGEKLQLVEMVSKNALLMLEQFEEKLKKEGNISAEGLRGLTALTGLQNQPYRIEAYDISNTGSTEIVASMVVFENGMPANREYRKFRIKSLREQDDYASLQEVLFRRFRHAEREKAEMEDQTLSAQAARFSKLPDLLLVDGGAGHVSSAREVLKQLGVNIPVWGMVKDDRHRTRGLVSEDGEIDLTKNMQVLRFVTAIQDEAHRVALQYNRKLRETRHAGSQLDQIEGIGEMRRKALLKHFKSMAGIKNATAEELAAVDGMNRSAAQKVWEHFHKT